MEEEERGKIESRWGRGFTWDGVEKGKIEWDPEMIDGEIKEGRG